MNIKNSCIKLNNIHCYAYHGVLPQENRVGNDYVVNLTLHIDLTKAGVSDSLNDTVNYSEVAFIVREEMKHSSKLIEHVCYRIGCSVLEKFTTITEVYVEVIKRNPPMGADIDSASVSMNITR